MVVLGGLGAELEPRGQAPRRVPANVGLTLPDFRLGKTRVVGEARIGEVRQIAEVAAGGLRDWPIGVVEGGAVELEREAGERGGGEVCGPKRGRATYGWVQMVQCSPPSTSQAPRRNSNLGVTVRVCAYLCSWLVESATWAWLNVKSFSPSPVTEARPPGTLKAAVRLSMKASKELYIAPRERASEGVKRSVKRGWVIAVTLVRTHGRGSVGVVAALSVWSTRLWTTYGLNSLRLSTRPRRLRKNTSEYSGMAPGRNFGVRTSLGP